MSTQSICAAKVSVAVAVAFAVAVNVSVSVAKAVAVVVCRDVTHMWAILCRQCQLLLFFLILLLLLAVVVTVFSQTCAYGFLFYFIFCLFWFLFSTGFYGLCVNKATFKAL